MEVLTFPPPPSLCVQRVVAGVIPRATHCFFDRIVLALHTASRRDMSRSTNTFHATTRPIFHHNRCVLLGERRFYSASPSCLSRLPLVPGLLSMVGLRVPPPPHPPLLFPLLSSFFPRSPRLNERPSRQWPNKFRRGPMKKDGMAGAIDAARSQQGPRARRARDQPRKKNKISQDNPVCFLLCEYHGQSMPLAPCPSPPRLYKDGVNLICDLVGHNRPRVPGNGCLQRRSRNSTPRSSLNMMPF